MLRYIIGTNLLAAMLFTGMATPAPSEETPNRGILSTGKSESKRPNIFFFFADDWGRYAGIHENDPVNSILQTPSIDRLGKEGVCFTNAHVSAPSCTPCRSALFSGQHFYRTSRGAILRPAVWDTSIPVFPLLLEQAGYRIGFTYKAWSPGANPDAPFGGARTRFVKAGSRFNRFSHVVTKMVAEGKDREAAKEELYTECLRNFELFLEAGKKTPDEAAKPFLYYFGPTNTHRSWEKGSGRALWDMNPDDLQGKMPKFLPDVPEIREDFCDYLGEVLALDAVLKRFLEKLEEIGELDDTIIVMSGDHGIPGFPRGKCNLYDFGTGVPLLVRYPEGFKGGRTVEDFVNLMDLAPTFLEICGLTPPENMTGRSLLPLLRSNENGQIDPARDYVVTGRERHVEKARPDLTPYPQRAFRTKDFLYIRNFHPERWPAGDPYHRESKEESIWKQVDGNVRFTFADMDAGPTKTWLVLNGEKPAWKTYWNYAFAKRPAEELYDLREDPCCLVNVAENPEYAEVRLKLSERLMEVLTSTGDPRVTGDGLHFETPPYAGPGTEENPTSPK